MMHATRWSHTWRTTWGHPRRCCTSIAHLKGTGTGRHARSPKTHLMLQVLFEVMWRRMWPRASCRICSLRWHIGLRPWSLTGATHHTGRGSLVHCRASPPLIRKLRHMVGHRPPLVLPRAHVVSLGVLLPPWTWPITLGGTILHVTKLLWPRSIVSLRVLLPLWSIWSHLLATRRNHTRVSCHLVRVHMRRRR